MKRTKRSSKRDESKMQAPDPQNLKPEVYFDLDGTLAVNTWPSTHVGEPIWETVALLQKYREEGWVCSIWTSRPEDHRQSIWAWLEDNYLDGYIYQVICGKPVYGLNVDDRSWCPPWLTTPQSKTKSPQSS